MPSPAHWSDPTLPPADRAGLRLAAMSFDEKVDLVMGRTESLARMGLPLLEKVDASGGLRGDTGVTAFPAPIGLAATFDADLAYEYGAAIAREARAHGWSMILGPTLDVERRGDGGRLPEGYGEDPLLNGVIGERVSRGMQDQKLITNLKHYTAYTQETGRNTLSVRVSERALHERYNAPFHHVITRGSALSIMGAYPKINGVYACENAALMDALRGETGWPGFMLSDAVAGEDPIAGFNAGIDSTTLYLFPEFPRAAFSDGRIAPARLDQAVRRTLHAIFASGLFEHPVGPHDKTAPVSTPVHRALARRAATQSIVLLKNRGGLLPLARTKIKTLALIGPTGRDCVTGPEGSSFVIPGDYMTPRDAIEQAASAANGALRVVCAQGTHGDAPLPAVPAEAFSTPEGTPGLLGTFYASTDFTGEPIATQIAPTLDFAAAPLDGLPRGWSARWTGRITAPVSGWVNFSVLCSGAVKVYIAGALALSGFRDTPWFFTNAYPYALQGGAMLHAGQPADIVIEFSTPFSPLHMFMGKHLHLGWELERHLPAAVAAAAEADVAVVWVNQVSGEGMDRGFALPGDQDRLIDAVCAANPNTILVLNTPGAVLMPWLDRAAAVLQAWYPGESIGVALADVLFGDAEPGGRLPLTFPAAESQCLPAYAGGGHVELSEGVFAGYRHFLEHGHTPLFAFGHGLSYTRFEYSALDISGRTVRVTVRNTGAREGSDIVQVYIGALPAPVPTPARQLAGFARVKLAPDASTEIQIEIPERVLSYWDESTHAWVLPHGRVAVYVGRSVTDTPLSGVLDVRDAASSQPSDQG
jgi:beta-glucosidase